MVIANLPSQLTPFIGRTDEMAAIANRLDDPNCRLLTLVGPGGIGKTRLALEMASHLLPAFADGVYFVALEPVASVDNIVSTVASAVGFEFFDSSRPEPQLLNYLQEKRLLLVLDNFEHLLPARGVVQELLNGAPLLKILVTTRESLNLTDEWLYQLDGLPFPQNKAIDAIDAYSAVQLFVERARRVRNDFSLVDEAANVVRVCQLVDGIPLGLELSAMWLRRLPCSEIAVEIQRDLDFLETDVDGVPYRHHSMRAVFDHSWRLLNEEERRALMGLSVFRGGFRREAAEQVIGASLPTLSALVDKSMLQVNPSGRYALHELQRRYAEERLDEMPERKVAVCDQHCAYFTEFMRRPERDFIGEANTATLQAIGAEIDNVRTAWSWAVERKRVYDLFKATRGLYWFAWLRNSHRECEQALREAVASLRDIEPTNENEVALGEALSFQGAMNIWLGRKQQARELLPESVAILRRLDARRELGVAVGALGWAAYTQQDWDTAKPLLQEAAGLDEESGQYEYQAFMLNLLGAMAYTLGQYAESEDWHRQALRLGRKIGDQRTIAHSLAGLGEIALTLGEFVKARRFYERSLAVARAHELRAFTIGALNQLGKVANATGELEAAGSYLYESLAIARDYGKPGPIAWTLVDLAHVIAAQGDQETAREQYLEAWEIATNMADFPLIASAQAGLGNMALASGDYVEAWQLYTESLSHYRQAGNRLWIANSLASLGMVALAQGVPCKPDDTSWRPCRKGLPSVHRLSSSTRCWASLNGSCDRATWHKVSGSRLSSQNTLLAALKPKTAPDWC
jgi:predicted ATPase/Tfp pilus assembly protein PilF